MSRIIAPSILKKVNEQLLRHLDGHGFKLSIEPGFGRYKIWRIITAAWGEISKLERIQKIQKILSPILATSEKRNIFRFSVLTPKEFIEFKNSI